MLENQNKNTSNITKALAKPLPHTLYRKLYAAGVRFPRAVCQTKYQLLNSLESQRGYTWRVWETPKGFFVAYACANQDVRMSARAESPGKAVSSLINKVITYESSRSATK